MIIILPHSRSRLLGAEQLQKTGGLGQDSLNEMLSRGGVCSHGPCLRGMVMSSMLACLLCCSLELLLFEVYDFTAVLSFFVRILNWFAN